MNKMNPEIKGRWVTALRSGEYKQTTNVLKGTEGHCCLGVLCDLYAQAHGMDEWDARNLGSNGDEEPGFAVRVWAGLSAADPTLSNGADGHAASAATMNDGSPNRGIRRHTFAEIADAIEKQL